MRTPDLKEFLVNDRLNPNPNPFPSLARVQQILGYRGSSYDGESERLFSTSGTK